MKDGSSSSSSSSAVRDLCFVVDATGSMTHFLRSLQESLPQVVHLTRLFGVRRVGVLVYRDYDVSPVTEFSGWHFEMDADRLGAFVARQDARGGGDFPEAAKTAAVRLLDLCGGTSGGTSGGASGGISTPCDVIWYTDAPPHGRYTCSNPRHVLLETAALGARFDWLRICRDFADAGHRVFAFLSTESFAVASFYAMLSDATGGCTLALEHANTSAIARQTVGLLLALGGHTYDAWDGVSHLRKNPTGPEERAAWTSEDDCGGFLPCVNRRTIPLDSQAMSAAVLDALGNPWGPQGTPQGPPTSGIPLTVRFATDAAFRDVAYAVLADVLRPSAILALTYNVVFGTLWREVCRSRGDPRRDALVARMGETVSTLPPDAKEALKSFIEASYDRSDAVVTAIAAAPPGGPRLVLEAPRPIPRAELLELSRSCHRGVLAKVGELLTGLRVVPDASEATPGQPGVPALPLSMAAKDLFAMLPHLMCPGTMFSSRPAAVLAVLAVFTGSVLREQAAELLASIRGVWIDAELPENNSADFVDLVLRVPSCLTPAELERFTGLRRRAGLLRNGRTDVEVATGFTSCKTVRPDRKVRCPTCQSMRSFTLVTPTGVCGLCVDAGGPSSIEEQLPDDRSCWCECRTCRVHYAVVDTKNLNVVPKCHPCRVDPSHQKNNNVPSVECVRCGNAFLCQRVALAGPDPFVCPPCEAAAAEGLSEGREGASEGHKGLSEVHKVTVRAYLAENGPGFLGFNIPDLDAFFDARSPFAARLLARDVPATPCISPTYDGKRVLNHEAVRVAIEGWIDRGEAESGCCMLCFEDLPKAALLSVCGRIPKRCDTRACRACLDAWYGAPRPGHLVAPTMLQCPFCKHVPSAKTLERHNREAMAIDRRGLATLDPAWHHGWCEGCYGVRPAVAKACTEAAPNLVNFRCDACLAAARRQDVAAAVAAAADAGPFPEVILVVRDCPGCHAAVHKTSGCNHINCPCGTHWCWACGHVGDTARAVYTHLWDEHRGIYDHHEYDD